MRILILALTAPAVLLSACASGDPLASPSSAPASTASTGSAVSLTVGSANFPESELLAELYAGALEAKGVAVTKKLNIASREYPLEFPHPGWSQQKPEDWQKAVYECIPELTREIDKSLVAGIGVGGEGFTTFTIAGPTGEGLTSARSFTRQRRCVLVDAFSIV